ncbi:MAG: hypothetical protein GF334_06320 [Candidatus Altiarchaeales archaeon]|nr:hypothetical protein [Candidatus Altiarchaeales archaeon]
MRLCISAHIRREACLLAHRVAESVQPTESPYRNIFLYQKRIDPSDPSWMINMGPPSQMNEPGRSQRGDPSKLIQYQQGKRPGPIDPLLKDQPMLVTVPGNPKEDAQGEVSDNVKTKGRDSLPDGWIGEDDNRDTIGFDPGTLNVNPF